VEYRESERLGLRGVVAGRGKTLTGGNAVVVIREYLSLCRTASVPIRDKFWESSKG